MLDGSRRLLLPGFTSRKDEIGPLGMEGSRLVQLPFKSFFFFLSIETGLYVTKSSSLLSTFPPLNRLGSELVVVDGRWNVWTDSPVMESLHVVPQSGSQVSDTHLLLLQRSEVLLRLRGPDPMVVAAACVLDLAPGLTSSERVCCSWKLVSNV